MTDLSHARHDAPEVPTSPPDLTRAEAKALTGAIRGAAVRVFDALAEVELAIERAYTGRAWLALGYETWDSYCGAEFSGSRLWASVEERHSRTLKLRDAGLSQRAIAAVLGVGNSTVDRDLASLSGAPDGAPDSGSQGVDGRDYPARRIESADLLRRRVEVFRLRDSGASQQEVARRLRVSQATVSTDEKAFAELLAEVDEADAARAEELAAAGRADLDQLASLLGIDVLTGRLDVGDVFADAASGKAKELRRVAKSLHDDVIFRDDILASDAGALHKSVVAAAPALAEAVQTSVRCLWRLDARLLDPRARERATELVDVAISDLKRWREGAG